MTRAEVQRLECLTGRDYLDRYAAPGRDGHKIKNQELSTTWSMVGSECLTASYPDGWAADRHWSQLSFEWEAKNAQPASVAS